MTDLAHGASRATILFHGVHVHAPSTEFNDSDNLGYLPIIRKVPVEPQFNIPAIVRERWRKILPKNFVLANTRKYNDSGFGLSVFAEERAET